jgi:hypothetical protein
VSANSRLLRRSSDRGHRERTPRGTRQELGHDERIWLVTTNDILEALRFYQRRGFRLSALRAGAVDEARKRLEPQISTVGGFGIPIRDEIEVELRPIETSSSRE